MNKLIRIAIYLAVVIPLSVCFAYCGVALLLSEMPLIPKLLMSLGLFILAIGLYFPEEEESEEEYLQSIRQRAKDRGEKCPSWALKKA